MNATAINLPTAKGRWIRTPDAALLLRKELGSGRDWDSWLKEDRRERHADCFHVVCYTADDHVYYDSSTINQLISDIRSGRVNPRHRKVTSKVTEPVVRCVNVGGEERIKVVTNGRGLALDEARRLIFRLAEEYKSLLSKVVAHA